MYYSQSPPLHPPCALTPSPSPTVISCRASSPYIPISLGTRDSFSSTTLTHPGHTRQGHTARHHTGCHCPCAQWVNYIAWVSAAVTNTADMAPIFELPDSERERDSTALPERGAGLEEPTSGPLVYSPLLWQKCPGMGRRRQLCRP